MNIGAVIDNNQLCEHFKCSPQGGMRRSLTKNSLVLISNHAKSIYDDRWLGDTFHYTGMGLEGNQVLNYSQNKTLAISNSSDISVHLFEVFKNKEYTYLGEVILAGSPYQESQIDKSGAAREVWMFPLQTKSGVTPIITDQQLTSLKEIKEKKAKKLSLSELKKRAQSANSKPGTRKSNSNIQERDEFIAEYTKILAQGICQLCNEPAPFKNKKNEPFLESHHIVWLSKGGDDKLENTIALCPNCHRKMHILNCPKDVKYLLLANKKITVD